MLLALTLKNSTQRASQELSIPRAILRRQMDKMKLKPYLPRLVHGISENE